MASAAMPEEEEEKKISPFRDVTPCFKMIVLCM